MIGRIAVPKKQKVVVAEVEIIGVFKEAELERLAALKPYHMRAEVAAGLANYFGPGTRWSLKDVQLEERLILTDEELQRQAGQAPGGLVV
jgi:hypothetical protein